MWPFGRVPQTNLKLDHEGCRIALESKDAIISECKKIIEDLRKQNEELHLRALEMHGYGHQEHMRALEQRKALGPVAVRMAEKGEATLQEQLEKAIMHTDEAEDAPMPLEMAPEVPLSRRNGDTVDAL